MKLKTIPFILFLFCLLLSSTTIFSQNIKGRILDGEDFRPMPGVLIHNIHSGEKVYSDENGQFKITGKKDELLEIKDYGYRTVRIRLYENPNKFLEIKMYIQPFELNDVVIFGNNPNRKIDSIKTAEIFDKQLNFEKLDPIESFRHPLTALSKSNRKIWEFQARYEWMEKEKFIDYTFNDKLIQNLTQLGSDSIEIYKRRFRPKFEWFEYWTNYEYYQYIIKTVELFRNNSKYYNIKEE